MVGRSLAKNSTIKKYEEKSSLNWKGKCGTTLKWSIDSVDSVSKSMCGLLHLVFIASCLPSMWANVVHMFDWGKWWFKTETRNGREREKEERKKLNEKVEEFRIVSLGLLRQRALRRWRLATDAMLEHRSRNEISCKFTWILSNSYSVDRRFVSFPPTIATCHGCQVWFFPLFHVHCLVFAVFTSSHSVRLENRLRRSADAFHTVWSKWVWRCALRALWHGELVFASLRSIQLVFSSGSRMTAVLCSVQSIVFFSFLRG